MKQISLYESFIEENFQIYSVIIVHTLMPSMTVDMLSSLAFTFSLDSYTWEPTPEFSGEGDAPCPRAGHAAAIVGTRIYIWSGRDGYKKVWNSQVYTHNTAYQPKTLH